MSGQATTTALSSTVFGELADGTPVERWVLDDGTVRVAVLSYGGALHEITTPDRNDRRTDVSLGFDTLTGYLRPQPYLGALIGRYANRIAAGRFALNGRTYRLEANDGRNHLHGGSGGFDKRVWSAEPITDGVRLALTSPDGDQGYPARLDVTVEYTLGAGNLRIAYAATNAEREGGPDTIVNLTNHCYFNLAGHGAGPIGDHVIEVPADRYAPSDAELIPTGALADVTGTPLDLRVPRAFSDGWDAAFEQIANASGYDHSWLLDGVEPGRPVLAARVIHPDSGRVLEVMTDQPAIHVYSGNRMEHLPGAKGGQAYERRGGFCLETHHLPDSPNHPDFPSTVLAPRQTFRSTTTYRFGTT
ncbi:MAG TPA: aldose epimerase family protein [Kineosporiaceae bacterium]